MEFENLFEFIKVVEVHLPLRTSTIDILEGVSSLWKNAYRMIIIQEQEYKLN